MPPLPGVNQRIRSLVAFLRPGAQVESRSQERYRRLAWTAGASALARVVSVGTSLASIPLTIGYLGTERFALWMTINSLMAMLIFADLGLGNGLMTAISESHGKEDMETARQYISSAFFMLLWMGMAVVVILAASFGHVPWAHILGAGAGAASGEAALAATVFFANFACNLPLGIVQRIQSGFQSGYTTNAWNTFGALLGFTGIVICARLHAGVPWLVLSFGAGPVVATMMNGLQLFRSRPDLLPQQKYFHWAVLRKLLAVGCGFVVLQAALAMAMGSDNFVIAHLLGPKAVAEYAVAMRIFTVVPGVLMMLVMPMWPAYGESVARGDTAWAMRALKRALLGIGAVTVTAALILTLSGRWIITLWVGNRFHPSLWLLGGMGLWMVLNSFANVVSVFLNSINRVHVQVIFAAAMAISTLTIELLATPKFGLPAMIWSTNLSYLVFIWIPIAVFFPRLLKNLNRKADAPRQDPSAEPVLVA
jgi:O-antigen/teichoic acid export membrane protein